MHLLRSGRKAPPALPMPPQAAITEEADEDGHVAHSVEPVQEPLELNAYEIMAAGRQCPDEEHADEDDIPSPEARKASEDDAASKDAESDAGEAQHAMHTDGETETEIDSALLKVGLTVVTDCLLEPIPMRHCLHHNTYSARTSLQRRSDCLMGCRCAYAHCHQDCSQLLKYTIRFVRLRGSGQTTFNAHRLQEAQLLGEGAGAETASALLLGQASGNTQGQDPVQLVLRIGRGFTPEPVSINPSILPQTPYYDGAIDVLLSL